MHAGRAGPVTGAAGGAEEVQRLWRRGIAAFELNLSCPNTSHGGIEFGADPECVRRIVAGCRARTRLPLSAKLSPVLPDIVTMHSAVRLAGPAIGRFNQMVMATAERVSRALGYGGAYPGPVSPVSVAPTLLKGNPRRVPPSPPAGGRERRRFDAAQP